MDIQIFYLFILYSYLILTLPLQSLNETQIGVLQPNLKSSGQQDIYNQSLSTFDNFKSNKSSARLIYGVRWFLGDYFSFTNLYRSHSSNISAFKYAQNINYYILAFNSFQKLPNGPFLEIVGTMISCSYSKISVPFSNDHNYLLSSNTSMNSTDAHIYKCYVNMDLRKTSYKTSDNQYRFDEYPYQIFVYQKNKAKHNFTEKMNDLLVKKQIFKSTFRSPLPKLNKQSKIYLDSNKQQGIFQQKAVVFGDWSIISKQTQQSKGYFSILQSVASRIQEDKNLILTVFLGDLAYDFVSDNYYPSLLNLQQISSRICFMATPGNHEYYYHADSFQIFAQTFFSPQWSKYFNLYYTFILGDFLFISYQPQNTGKRGGESNIKPIQYMLNDFYNKQKLNSRQNSTSSKQSPVNSNYEVIVFSHYPIICSKLDDSSKSCENKNKLKNYLKTFNDIGMDLYLAAHVHYYDRTHCLCWKQKELNFSIDKPAHSQIYSESNQTTMNEIYLSKCPVYLVEGGGGNQYFVQPEGAVNPLQVTSKLGFKTGYGILSMKSSVQKNIKLKRKQILNSIEFSHYKMTKRNQSKLWDRFTKILSVLSHNFIEMNLDDQKSQNMNQKKHNKTLKKDQNYFKQVIIVSFIGTLVLIIILTFIFKKVRIYLKRFRNIDLNEEKDGQKSQKYIIKEEKN